MLKSKRIIYHFDSQGYIKTIVIGGLLSLFVLTMPVFAAGNLPVKQEQLERKSAESRQTENNISLSDAQQKKDNYQKAKDTYLQPSQNSNIFSQEQIVQFLNDCKNAEKAIKTLETRLQEIKGEKERIEDSLIALSKEKKGKEMEILGVKAELYENELSKAVWVEGVGEYIMDENKTMKECEKLALECARRDAMEKGSRSLIEFVTEIKMFDLTKDDIKKTGTVTIIEQDTNGEFGKAKKIIVGDTFKFTAKVRLKIQSVASYNPYREKMKDLQGEEKQVSPKVIATSNNELPVPMNSVEEKQVSPKVIAAFNKELPAPTNSVKEKQVSSPKVIAASNKELPAPTNSVEKKQASPPKTVATFVADKAAPAALRHFIGEHYGGGIIFFVSENGQHGLIAAIADQSAGMRWYAGSYINTGAIANGVGAGKENTAIIIAKQGKGDGSNYAAKLCANYSITVDNVTYNDWYLPSKHELNLLYQQRSVVGGFAYYGYWSSTENGSFIAWNQYFASGYNNSFNKNGELRVRAVRAF